MPSTILDLATVDANAIDELAELSWAAARRHAPTWLPTLDDAREEIDDALEDGKIARALVDGAGRPLAWIGAMHAYGKLWEIDPLLVAVEHQGKGLGRRLVADIEPRLVERGAVAIFVGTSDETGSTSLSREDLYADPGGAITRFTAVPAHAVGFWQHLGYVIVGTIPDAEGLGRPSIQMSKRVG